MAHIAVDGERDVVGSRAGSSAQRGIRLSEPQLVAAVNALLARSVPVYVVQANDALPMGGKAVLSQYFTISEVDAAFHLLRLERAPTGMTAGD